jgi:putative two-component system response regulator
LSSFPSGNLLPLERIPRGREPDAFPEGRTRMEAEAGAILVVDDEPAIRRLLATALSSEGYRCLEAANSNEAIDMLGSNSFGLILLDNKMPGRPGIELLPEIRKAHPDTLVVMATATTDIDVAVECIRRGAYDYITKPLNLHEIKVSVRRAFEKRRLELENRDYRQNLETRVAQQAGKIRALSLSAITALVTALEAKDEYTSGHSQRVAEIAAAIAMQMNLPQNIIDHVHLAGLVHDIGKIGVRESVLNKPDRLTPEELQHARRHPEIGENILLPIGGDEGIQKVVRAHHERYDGTGYPDGLKGDEIPLGARILAVSDAYEAMTSERPYRSPLSNEAARAELGRGKGTQFDPSVVDAFLGIPRPSEKPHAESGSP